MGGAGLDDPGVPYSLEYIEASRKAAAQARGKPVKGKKALADPVMVPMKKAEASKPNAPAAPRG